MKCVCYFTFQSQINCLNKTSLTSEAVRGFLTREIKGSKRLRLKKKNHCHFYFEYKCICICYFSLQLRAVLTQSLRFLKVNHSLF